MQYDLYHELSRKGKQSFLRLKKNWGRRYQWYPRAHTIEAIAYRRKWPEDRVKSVLLAERRHYELTLDWPE